MLQIQQSPCSQPTQRQLFCAKNRYYLHLPNLDYTLKGPKMEIEPMTRCPQEYSSTSVPVPTNKRWCRYGKARDRTKLPLSRSLRILNLFPTWAHSTFIQMCHWYNRLIHQASVAGMRNCLVTARPCFWLEQWVSFIDKNFGGFRILHRSECRNTSMGWTTWWGGFHRDWRKLMGEKERVDQHSCLPLSFLLFLLQSTHSYCLHCLHA